MKLRLLALSITLAAASACHALTDDQKESYKEVSVQVLRIDADSHKNDKVAIKGSFLGVAATFYSYFEESGFKPDRYLAFSVGSVNLPILARKKDDLVAQIADLKRGTTVTVYGRVKEFRSEPKSTRLPKYYLEFEAMEIEMPTVRAGLEKAEEAAAPGAPWQKRRQDRRRN